MLNKIQRYNQGFGSFGPLEQCTTGKLMKAEDVLSYADKVRSYTDNLEKTQTQALVDTRSELIRIAAASRLDLIEGFSNDIEVLECSRNALKRLCKDWEQLCKKQRLAVHIAFGAFLATLLYTLLKQSGVL